MKILFLGESYRADAISWIRGIEKVSGIKITIAEIEISKSRFGRAINALKFLFKILWSRTHQKFDLVLAERATSYGFFSLLVNGKVRVVAQQGITDAYPEIGFSGFYKRILQKQVYKNVSLIHAWGNVMVEAMILSGAEPNKILVKPKGINLDFYTKREPQINKIPIGIVTRSLAEIYHHEDILNAIYFLKKKGIPFKCMIVGEGPLRKKLEGISNKLNIRDRVEFKGKVPNDLLPSLLRQSDIYISVPETEGVSTSLFEAMASGCLPIVTDLRANRQFIKSRKNGYLVPMQNPEKLAETIQVAIDSYNEMIPGILSNRKFIEKEADLSRNMEFFYDVYLQKLQEFH